MSPHSSWRLPRGQTMEQSHTDLGEGVVGAGASACPACPLSRLQRRLFIRLSARTHGMLGTSTLARWQREGRREGGKRRREEEAGTLMESLVKSERPHQAPPGTEPAHKVSLLAHCVQITPAVTGSIAGEADAQTSCVCEISVFSLATGSNQGSKQRGGPGCKLCCSGLGSSGSETPTLRQLHCWKRLLDPNIWWLGR